MTIDDHRASEQVAKLHPQNNFLYARVILIPWNDILGVNCMLKVGPPTRCMWQIFKLSSRLSVLFCGVQLHLMAAIRQNHQMSVPHSFGV